eukprot:CAMPEP_0118853780 /NCGR_PEP_ID=MMETSP1163-20130328/2244_1 /TAXON_ID=124430 /ORGANISM="Phaeomonas parva, Strain CCMP2877" /LENGTH=124 /DNA_ID=CAMNT_0006786391 /DNA_START=99 /DNA_END=469 /DNA_ORIENTATION=-
MASVFLGDLDDFLGPGDTCVNPLFAAPADPNANANANASGSGSGSGGALKLELDDGPGGLGLDAEALGALAADTSKLISAVDTDKGAVEGPKIARVALSDCLACSGCVTSAETVLLESQGTAAL